jgi:hypothetical protein
MGKRKVSKVKWEARSEEQSKQEKRTVDEK